MFHIGILFLMVYIKNENLKYNRVYVQIVLLVKRLNYPIKNLKKIYKNKKNYETFKTI